MEFQKGKKKPWLVVGILILMSIFALTGQATTVSELESQTEILQKKLSDINGEIVAINEELESVNSQIEMTEAAIAKTSEELIISKQEESKQYESMKLRIKYMYEAGESSFLEILFGAESLADFVNRTDFITSITEYDREMQDELQAIREQVEFEEETLKKEKESLVALKVESEEKEKELQEKANETQTDLVQVKAEIVAEKARIAEEERLAAEQAQNESSNAGSGGSTNSGSSYEGSASELDLFAAILDCEAGADYNSRLAVATVIMNRVESSRFPNSITDVIYQQGQFSPVWTGKLDKRLEIGASSLSYQVAKDAMAGTRHSSVSHCYYFLYAPSTSRDGVEIGNNLFFASW